MKKIVRQNYIAQSASRKKPRVFDSKEALDTGYKARNYSNPQILKWETESPDLGSKKAKKVSRTLNKRFGFSSLMDKTQNNQTTEFQENYAREVNKQKLRLYRSLKKDARPQQRIRFEQPGSSIGFGTTQPRLYPSRFNQKKNKARKGDGEGISNREGFDGTVENLDHLQGAAGARLRQSSQKRAALGGRELRKYKRKARRIFFGESRKDVSEEDNSRSNSGYEEYKKNKDRLDKKLQKDIKHIFGEKFEHQAKLKADEKEGKKRKKKSNFTAQNMIGSAPMNKTSNIQQLYQALAERDEERRKELEKQKKKQKRKKLKSSLKIKIPERPKEKIYELSSSEEWNPNDQETTKPTFDLKIDKQATKREKKKVYKAFKEFKKKERIFKFRQESRQLPDSAFQAYFGKPAFNNYGMNNVLPLWKRTGRLMRTHNVNPHRYPNDPRTVQVHQTAELANKRLVDKKNLKGPQSWNHLPRKCKNEFRTTYSDRIKSKSRREDSV